MQVINEAVLTRFVRRHPTGADWLENWLRVARAADWRTILDVKKAFPAVDGGVKVRSGGTVTIFDVCGNRYRIIAAIVFSARVMTILEILTHAEYSKDRWKDRY